MKCPKQDEAHNYWGSLSLRYNDKKLSVTTAGDKIVRTISLFSFFNGEKPLDNVVIETTTTGRWSERVP
ncbi:hypothetical protein SAMN04487948_11867 [Halogranum amylolyticum]|uniref:Uncharacterized protein n=1 Tax=Halogranum amylolyticum TaxID=660520 RepID=A0A1H8VPM9_9EURY|nr:hypothetical protein SAMN04487948_11867 [Halogranum amylolyticum]